MFSKSLVFLLLLPLTSAPTTKPNLEVTLYARDPELIEGNSPRMAIAVTNMGRDDLRLFSYPWVVLVSKDDQVEAKHNDEQTAFGPIAAGPLVGEDMLSVVLEIEAAQEYSVYDRSSANIYSGGLTPDVLRPGSSITMRSGLSGRVLRPGKVTIRARVLRGKEVIAESNEWTYTVRPRSSPTTAPVKSALLIEQPR